MEKVEGNSGSRWQQRSERCDVDSLDNTPAIPLIINNLRNKLFLNTMHRFFCRTEDRYRNEDNLYSDIDDDYRSE